MFAVKSKFKIPFGLPFVRNYWNFAGIFGGACLAMFIIYTPPLHRVFGMLPILELKTLVSYSTHYFFLQAALTKLPRSTGSYQLASAVSCLVGLHYAYTYSSVLFTPRLSILLLD